MPGKPIDKIDNNTKATRIIVGSTSKYSAMPAHTPAIILLRDLISFLSIIIYCLILKQRNKKTMI